MPKISVIVPVYKVEKYLDRCVESIIEQSFTDFELILVDDGSPDKCPEMCDEWALRDNRIKVIHKENGGLSDARNAALDVASGDYISFIDSDDYVSSDFLESMYAAVNKYNCKMAVSNLASLYDDGSVKDMYSPKKTETYVTGEEMYDTLYKPDMCIKLFDRSIFEDLRFPKGKLYEDCFIYHLILEKLDGLVYVGKTMYYYYIRSDSIMHDKYGIKNTDIVDAVYERAVFLDSHGHHKHADEAYLAMYTRLASAYTLLDRRDPNVIARLSELKRLFNTCYKRIVTDKHISLKQKTKIRLFRYFPVLHTKLFPMITV